MIIYGTYGNDNLAGTSLDDQLYGFPATGNSNEAAGNDTLSGGEGNDLVAGGTGNDNFSGGNGNDTLKGSGGSDQILGNAGADLLVGGTGNDLLKGGGGADELQGGEGIDEADYSFGSIGISVNLANPVASGGDAQGDTLVGIENVFGSSDDDAIAGDSGSNRLNGSAGDDLLKGGGGADMLIGGLGTDDVSYFGSNAGVFVSLTSGTGFGGEAEGDTLIEVENIVGSGFADELTGNGGANALRGGSGDDTLKGGGDADTLDGGSGIDTASYFSAGAGVVANLASPAANAGDAAGDVYVGVEYLQGSSFDDVLIGDANGNFLIGSSGADQLVGNAGIDTMQGDAGDDFYYVENTSDVVLEAQNQGLDRVFATVNVTLSANVEVLFLQGSAVSGIGNDLDNTILGNAGSNFLSGAGGSDYLVDGGGADYMVGGAGDDLYFVSSGGGTVFENAGEGFDRLFATVTTVMADNVEALILQGSGAVAGIGNGGDNGILGNAGDNVLSGGAGNDVIYGLGGSDTFVFRAGYGRDTIVDFQGAGAAGGDALQIDPALAANFAAFQALGSQSGADATYTFAGGATLTLLNVNFAGLTASDVVFA